jgi:molecular chaperone DnaJ
MEKNYYSILGVNKNASDQEIRKAYLKLSKQYHPDMQSGKTDEEKHIAEEKCKEINEAYEILSNKEKREYYDNFGTTGPNHSFGGGGMDPREFFRKFKQSRFNMDGFDDDFDFNPFNQSHNNHNTTDIHSPKNGRSIEIQTTVTLEDVLYGSTKHIEITISDPCTHCFGTGAKDGEMSKCQSCDGTGIKRTMPNRMTIIQTMCNECHGTGRIHKHKCPHCNNGNISNIRKIDLTIPQGISEGGVIKINGKGEKGLNGGKDGDIYLIISTQTHSLYKRQDSNLIMELYISPIKAILGGNVDLQTPWGLISLTIPQYTNNDKIFRIKEKGIKQGSNQGDLFVKIKIDDIKNCSQKQIDLLKQLEQLITNDNLEKTKIQNEKFESFRKNNIQYS